MQRGRANRLRERAFWTERVERALRFQRGKFAVASQQHVEQDAGKELTKALVRARQVPDYSLDARIRSLENDVGARFTQHLFDFLHRVSREAKRDGLVNQAAVELTR